MGDATLAATARFKSPRPRAIGVPPLLDPSPGDLFCGRAQRLQILAMQSLGMQADVRPRRTTNQIARIRQSLAQSEPNAVEAGRSRAKVDQSCATSTDFGRAWAGEGRIRPRLGRSQPSSAKTCLEAAKADQVRADATRELGSYSHSKVVGFALRRSCRWAAAASLRSTV